MQTTNLVVSNMAGVCRCRDCHMTFQTQALLTKHKSKFCVGSSTAPDQLQMQRGFRSVSPPRYLSPDDRPYTDSELVNKKIGQLRQLKDRRSRSRDMNDLEERILLDKITWLDQSPRHQLEHSPRQPRSKAIPLSRHRDIRDLQMEYERLRELENNVAKQPVRLETSRAGRLSPYSRDSNSSMSIHIDDDYRRPNQDQYRSLAESHGRQMQYLQLRNKDLEKQRDDIMKRLEGLGRRPMVVQGAAPAHDNTADLLREMRDQERRNQQALDELKRQMYDLNNNQKVNVIEVPVERAAPPPPQLAPPPPQEPPRQLQIPIWHGKNLVAEICEVERPVQAPPAPLPMAPPEPKRQLQIPVYYGKSLVGEICAIRQAYIANGGNDPDTLAQMSMMQLEAQAIEDEANKKPEKKPEKPKENSDLIKMMEAQNQQLTAELRMLYEQKWMSQNQGRSGKEDELAAEIRRLQQEHLDKMSGLHREMDDLKLMMMMERNRAPPQAPNTVIHQAPQQGVNLKPYIDIEGMQPYEQYYMPSPPMVRRVVRPPPVFVSPRPCCTARPGPWTPRPCF